MARILPPAVSRRQEILSIVCMCINERETERAAPRVKRDGTRAGTLVRVWGLCTSRKAKVMLKLDNSSGSSLGKRRRTAVI